MAADLLARLFRLLDLLAAQGTVRGGALTSELGIDERTLRRDVDRLRELGYPVESVRGRHGGYRLARTGTLPPLVLDDRQAVAVVLGIDAIGRAGLDIDGSEALADHLVELLPDEVAARVGALRASLAAVPASSADGRGIPAARLLDLGSAVDSGRSVHLRYVDRRGRTTDRELEPWGIVQHRGRWYVVGHDHRADDVRLFRVDRIIGVLPGGPALVSRPDGLDLRTHVEQQLMHTAWTNAVEVELHADLSEARRRVPQGVGEVVEEAGRVWLRVGAEDLEGMARVLASLGLDLTVVHPPELRTALADLADRIATSASREPAAP